MQDVIDAIQKLAQIRTEIVFLQSNVESYSKAIDNLSKREAYVKIELREVGTSYQYPLPLSDDANQEIQEQTKGHLMGIFQQHLNRAQEELRERLQSLSINGQPLITSELNPY